MGGALVKREWFWPVVAALVSAAMLAAAHAFERFGGLPPCPLCLKQRDVYWAAMGVAGTGLALWSWRPQGRFIFALHVLIGMVFLTGALVAAFHAGGEWKLWDLPPSCTATGEVAPIDPGLFAIEGGGGTPTGPIDCSDAPWRMFGISMAGYNAAASLGLAMISFAFAARLARRQNLAFA